MLYRCKWMTEFSLVKILEELCLTWSSNIQGKEIPQVSNSEEKSEMLRKKCLLLCNYHLLLIYFSYFSSL